MAEVQDRTSRRSLIGALIAAAGTGAVVAARPAAAANGDPVTAGQDTTATSRTRVIKGTANPLADVSAAFVGDANDDAGVGGNTRNGPAGVLGVRGGRSGHVVPGAGAAVVGDSGSDTGVAGLSDGVGVYGKSGGSQPGILGEGVRFGVLGRGIENDGEIGVGGQSHAGTGVEGRSGSGTGAHGFSESNTGMFGYGGRTGVFGFSFPGLGGVFGGGRAALQLIPRGVTGAPTSGAHERGELIIDSAGALYVCTAPGTPGVWKRITVS